MTIQKATKQTKTGEGSQPLPGDQAFNRAQSTRPMPPIQTRVLTHNIRYATKTPFKGEERWPIRCPRLCAELIFNSVVPASFICLQEVLHEQLQDIIAHLNDPHEGEWAYIGVGREDGGEAGEYSPIFYRPSVWQLAHWHTVWLSKTPDVPSKGWDASSTRIATIGLFVDPQHGRKILVSSTHFDNDGAESRRESAKLLPLILENEAVRWVANAVILAGDFNSPPDDEAYEIITAPDSKFLDVRNLNPTQRRYGNTATFTGFNGTDKQERIDFIFTGKANVQGNPGDLEFKSYAVLSNRYEDGVYSSDHRAVVTDFMITPQ